MAANSVPPLPAASPASATPGSTLTPAQIEKTRKSAQDFEAMAIGQLLQPMFATVDTSKGLFGGGKAEAAWKPMMVDEMAKMLAKSGGIGIADSVMKEMLRIQEGQNAAE